MSRGLGGLELTASRTQLLWRLRALGPCTQRVLADELGVSARNVTGLVDALVDTGLVTCRRIEIPVLDLVLRSWPYVRIPILALGVWGLTFMIGLPLSLVVNPLAVGPFGIRVRYRAAADFTLPWETVRAVSMRRRPCRRRRRSS